MMRNPLSATSRLPVLALALLIPFSTACAAEDTAKASEANTIKAAGALTIQGDCRILTDPNGRKFALVGKVEAADGDQIRVTGKKADQTSCLQGPAIRVDKVEKIKTTQKAAEGQGKPEIEIVTSGPGPTKPDGVRMLKMRGTLNDEVKVKSCQGFRNMRGELWALTGDLETFKTGDKVMIEGVAVEGSECGPQTVKVNVIETFKE
jgi:hypothetical protein